MIDVLIDLYSPVRLLQILAPNNAGDSGSPSSTAITQASPTALADIESIQFTTERIYVHALGYQPDQPSVPCVM